MIAPHERILCAAQAAAPLERNLSGIAEYADRYRVRPASKLDIELRYIVRLTRRVYDPFL